MTESPDLRNVQTPEVFQTSGVFLFGVRLVGQRHLWSSELRKPGWRGQEALRMAPTEVNVEVEARLSREGPGGGKQLTLPHSGAIRKAY